MIDQWYEAHKDLIFTKEPCVNALRDAMQAKKSLIPRRLFQYQRFGGRALQNLENGVVYLANPAAFNDPYDCAITFKAIDPKHFLREVANSLEVEASEEVLALPFADALSAMTGEYHVHEELASEIAQIAEAYERISDDGRKLLSSNLRERMKISCFCERLDSTLMWAHYAEYHRGFAVEYDFASLPAKHYFSTHLWPVIYRDALFDASVMVPAIPYSVDVDRRNPMYGLAAALHKARDWSYEKEWRLLGTEPSSGGAAVEAPKPVAIYLGAQASNEDAERLRSIALQRDIPIHRMKLAASRYEMVPIPF